MAKAKGTKAGTETIKKTAEKVTETAKEAAEKVTEKVAEVAEVAKETAVKAKETAKETVTKTKNVAKKASASVDNVYVEFDGKQILTNDIIENAKKLWKQENNSVITSVDVYVKPEESKAYYVINKTDTGFLDL